MALTESTIMPIGTKAPDFTLVDTRNQQAVSREDYAGKPLLIVFMCNHCPYVVHILDALVKTSETLSQSGIATVAISANDAEQYPADSPERMTALAEEKGFQFPYCHDASQAVAKAYGAVCTPDIYLFDAEHALYYRGQFDDSRPGKGRASGSDVLRAAQLLTSAQPAPVNTSASVGCSIKWKT